MKKLSILFLTCFLAVNTMTANAQLISPSSSPTLLSNDLNFYSNWMSDYEPALAWAFENDILTGDGSTGQLRETECVKRAEILKMLYNVLEIDIANPQAELFSDTYEGEWYASYVRKARERSTIAGYPDGTFKPAQCVNRAEALKIALLEFPNINPVSTSFSGIADVPSTEWYYPYASYALANDLVGLRHTTYSSDYVSRNYYPGDSMTREEFAEMLYRLKTLQDNNLASYDAAFGPENVIQMPLQDYNMQPEEFLDYDTSLLAVLDTQNSSQISILNGFLSQSPAGDVDGFVELMLEELISELSRANLTFEDDLLPAFDDGYKVMYAMSKSDSFMPRQTVLITVQDSAQLNFVFDKLSSLSDYSKSSLFGFNTFTNAKQEVYFAYTDDVLLAWPSFSDRYLALQKIKNDGKNLLENSDYTEYLSTLPVPNVGMIYFSAPTGESGVFALVPDNNGLNLHYRVDGYGYAEGKAPYMYKKLPGNNLLAYGESYGMLDILTGQGDNPTQELQDEGVIVTAGDWMNQGYAFLMQDTGNLIPGLSLYFDATGLVSQAEEDLAVFDALMDELVADATAEGPEFADVITKDTVWVDGKIMDRLSFDMSALPQEELEDIEMFADFFATPIEFYYGITSDDYVVLSLYTGLNDVYGKVPAISANADVKEGMSFLAGYPDGLSYVSLENFIGYIDMLVLEFEESTEPMPADMKENYNEFLDYLAPIKYIIGAEKDFGGVAGGLMFVKID